MSGRSIDGKAIAAGIGDDVAAAVAALPDQPALAVVLVGEDPASQVYVRSKVKQTAAAGLRSVGIRLPDDTSSHVSTRCPATPRSTASWCNCRCRNTLTKPTCWPRSIP